MKKKKSGITTALLLAGMLVLASCSQLDVVGKESVTSFGKVLTAAADSVTAADDNSGWGITAPDGTARFVWASDFSKSEDDAFLEFDTQPFLAAGLDLNKLPGTIKEKDGLLRISADFGSKAPSGQSGATPISAYEQIVSLSRESINYHTALDHYGVALGGGNMFEWAKDTLTNDKDIVFVLDPQALIDAGVDPAGVEGWAFAKVKVMDANGKEIEVDKFLKPFDLE